MVPMTKRYIAEALGAFGLTIVPILYLGSANADGTNETTLAIAAIISGLSLMAMIYAMGHISGGHYNPSVTFGLAVAGRFPWKFVLPYLISQCLGAILAGGISVLMYGHATGAVTIPGSSTVPHALIAEAIITYLFVLTVLGVATDKRANSAVPGLAIGMVLIAIIPAAAGISGAGMNPARVLGPAIFAGGDAIKEYWVYVVGPLAGAALAGLLYELVRGGAEYVAPNDLAEANARIMSEA